MCSCAYGGMNVLLSGQFWVALAEKHAISLILFMKNKKLGCKSVFEGSMVFMSHLNGYRTLGAFTDSCAWLRRPAVLPRPHMVPK